MWATAKSNIPEMDKLDLLYDFDEVLGLRLRECAAERCQVKTEIPPEIQAMLIERNCFRHSKDFAAADSVRKEIEKEGWKVVDDQTNSRVEKI